MELITRTHGYTHEVLIEPFSAHGVTVPAGFEFDGASSPRIFWTIVPPFKQTKKAACIHDWLCRNAKNAEDRKRADKLFHKMLLEAGLNRVRAYAGYLGVRIGAHIGVGVYYKEGKK